MCSLNVGKLTIPPPKRHLEFCKGVIFFLPSPSWMSVWGGGSAAGERPFLQHPPPVPVHRTRRKRWGRRSLDAERLLCAHGSQSCAPSARPRSLGGCAGAGATDLKDDRAREVIGSSHACGGCVLRAFPLEQRPGGGGICALVSKLPVCASRVDAPPASCKAGPLHTPRTPDEMSR